MATPRKQFCSKSFAELHNLLSSRDSAGTEKKKHHVKKAGEKPDSTVCRKEEPVLFLPADCSEEDLFRKTIGEVVPLRTNAKKRGKRKRACKTSPPDARGACALRALIATGQGFIVSQTPEYMEGRGYGVSPRLARRLHRGDFSIQAHVDLHGYGVREACKAVDAFLLESVGARRRAVLIIHGRGLSSANPPVLKEKVREWLSTGRWGKWVLAFTSARAEDGGAGATYVLLRTKPVTKSERRGSTFVK